MNQTTRFSGILPAIVTPVDREERFQPRPFEALCERVYSAGVDGIYVCGQTGEGMQQPVSQRQEVAEAAVSFSPPGKTVILHIGAHTTADAVTLARHAGRCGAHAVSSLPPAGAYSFEEIRAYYRAVADASDLPLLIYYFPNIAPALRSVDQILELCTIPNVVGLKFTDSDFFKLWAIRQTGAIVFNGSDEMLVAGLLMGACGGIGATYNLMPEQFASLFRYAAAGDWTSAKLVQDQINELIAVILRFPVHGAVKSLLRFSGIECGPCITPRRSLTAAEEADLQSRAAATVVGQELLATV